MSPLYASIARRGSDRPRPQHVDQILRADPCRTGGRGARVANSTSPEQLIFWEARIATAAEVRRERLPIATVDVTRDAQSCLRQAESRMKTT